MVNSRALGKPIHQDSDQSSGTGTLCRTDLRMALGRIMACACLSPTWCIRQSTEHTRSRQARARGGLKTEDSDRRWRKAWGGRRVDGGDGGGRRRGGDWASFVNGHTPCAGCSGWRRGCRSRARAGGRRTRGGGRRAARCALRATAPSPCGPAAAAAPCPPVSSPRVWKIVKLTFDEGMMTRILKMGDIPISLRSGTASSLPSFGVQSCGMGRCRCLSNAGEKEHC